MSRPSRSSSSEQKLLLPDLCAAPRVMAVVVIAELLAIVLVLAPVGTNADRWRDLGLISLFIQWVALSYTGLLCLLRPWLQKLGEREAVLLGLSLLLAVVLGASEAAYWIARATGIALSLPEDWRRELMLRNLAIAAIVGGLAMRYFFVQQQWKRQVQAELQARVQALQARIRPHFLFNSLNTIASLIRTRPKAAEEAIQDLAELFRSSLSESRMVMLEDELALVRRYLHMEQLRLEQRLRIVLELDGVPQDAALPALTIQPLLENAVYYGIEPLPEGGTIRVTGQLRGDLIEIDITNPLAQTPHVRPGGHHMAQDSVRQRLSASYQGQGNVDVLAEPDQYRVRLSLPYVRSREEADTHEAAHRG